MADQVEGRSGRRPGRVLADGGFAQPADIEALHGGGVAVFAPAKGPRPGGFIARVLVRPSGLTRG
jgi:hypothetical protein